MLTIYSEVKDHLAGTTIDNNSSVIERCLIASHVYGDRFSIDFWTVVSHYLKTMKLEKQKRVSNPTSETEG